MREITGERFYGRERLWERKKREKGRERDNLLLGNINALHQYSHVNEGILN